MRSALIPYDEFRTGLTYKDVYAMLWSPSQDSKTWHYKGRHTVLGLWRSIKQDMYNQYASTMEVPF